MKTLRFRSVPPMAPASSSHPAVKGTRGLVSAMAVAAVLAVGGCSTVEDTWDSTWDTVFGGENATAADQGSAPASAETASQPAATDTGTAAPPPANGLVAAPHRAYDDSATRRAPTERHALVETPAEPSSSAPAPSAESHAAAVRSPAETVTRTPAPPAPQATSAVPMTAASGDALVGTSAETMQPRSLALTASAEPSGGSEAGLLIAPWDAADDGAAAADIGTTVINGDGTVSVEPGASVDYGGGAQGAGGVYVDEGGYGGPQAAHAFDPMGSGVSTLVATIQFGYGSARLGAEDRNVLRQVVALQKRYGGSVRVVGHASSRTANMEMDRHNEVNFATSVARADSVAETLAGMGIPREMIYSAAVSDSDPVYYEVMPSGEAGNRRADIYLDY